VPTYVLGLKPALRSPSAVVEHFNKGHALVRVTCELLVSHACTGEGHSKFDQIEAAQTSYLSRTHVMRQIRMTVVLPPRPHTPTVSDHRIFDLC